MSRIRARYHDPEARRHSVPTFMWQLAPAGYATRRQLTAQGLRPGGQDIAAQIMWNGIGGDRVAYLYRIDLALPKRTATPAQLGALAKALRARCTCRTCGQIRPYVIPLSLGECNDCSDGTAA